MAGAVAAGLCRAGIAGRPPPPRRAGVARCGPVLGRAPSPRRRRRTHLASRAAGPAHHGRHPARAPPFPPPAPPPPKTNPPGKPRCGPRASWPRSSARWTVAARSTRTAGTAENSGRGLRQRCGPGGGPLALLPGAVLGGKCPDFCIRHIAVVVRIRLVKSGRQAWKEPDLRAAELAVAIEIQHFE